MTTYAYCGFHSIHLNDKEVVYVCPWCSTKMPSDKYELLRAITDEYYKKLSGIAGKSIPLPK